MQFPRKFHQIYTDFTEIHIDKNGGGIMEFNFLIFKTKQAKKVFKT